MLDNQEAILENDFDRIFNYYLSGKKIPTQSSEFIQQGILLIVSLSGSSLYIMPSYALAVKHGSQLAGNNLLMRKINYIVSTCVSGISFLYNSTEIFLKLWKNENIPEEISELLINKKKNRNLEGAMIILGSAISAIPLMLVSFSYPLPVNSLSLKIIQGIIIEIDNTLLHFLPLKLAVQYKIYRIPVLPFEMIYNLYYENGDSNSIDKDSLNIKSKLIAYIHNVQHSLLIDKCNYGFYEYHWSKKFKDNFLDKISEFDEDDNLLMLLSKEFSFKEKVQTSQSHQYYAIISGILSSIWITSGFTGYFISTVNQLFSWTGNVALTSLIATPSIYLLGVLLTYYGYISGQELYEYLSKWDEKEAKFPLEFKLYPKTFTFLMMVNLYMMFYGYAAAEELVHDNFKGVFLENLKPTFIWLARTGIGFLGLSANKDFVKNLLRKFAIYCGDNETKGIARFYTSLEHLEFAINTIKPEILFKNKQYLEEISILKQDIPDEENFLINTPENDQNKYGWKDWIKSKCCCFWEQEDKSEKTYITPSPRNSFI